MSRLPVTDAELHAHVDGVLTPARKTEVEAYLAEHPEDAARVAAYREQLVVLHRQYDPALSEPLPPGLSVAGHRDKRPAWRHAALAAAFVLGIAVGWQLHAYRADQRNESSAWPRRAAIAQLAARLARNRATCALFDTDRSRRHIEAAYVTMRERQRNGEPPAGFSVVALSR